MRIKQGYIGPSRKPHQKFNGHTDLVQGAIHLPGGKRMITCSRDGSLRMWNSEDGSPIGKAWRDGESPVNTLALSPDGKTVTSGSDDGAVRLWDIGKGTVIAKWTGHSDRVLSVCWNRNGQRLASGSADGTARVWDVKSGKTTLGPIETKHETVYAVVYSPEDTMVATGGTSGSDDYIKIWDAKRFTLVATLKGHEWTVRCLAWATDGKILVSGSTDCTIRTWSTTTWKELTVLTHDDDDDDYPIVAVTISPNRRILASAMSNSTAELWDITNSRRIGSPLQHHHGTNAVHCVSFSEDGNLLATCNENNAYTWDISTIVKEAGFDDLLSRLPSNAQQDPAKNSVLDANSVIKPVKNISRLPPGFLDGTEGCTHSSSTQAPVGSFAHQPPTPGGLSLLLRRSRQTFREGTSHGAPTPFHSFTSTLVHFFRRHPDSEQRPPTIDVSHAEHNPRNVHPMKPSNKTLPSKNFVTMNISTNTSSTDVMQQIEPIHGQQQPSQLQNSLATTHDHGTIKTTPAGIYSSPDVMKRQAGFRPSLRRFLCCNSSEAVDGHR